MRFIVSNFEIIQIKFAFSPRVFTTLYDVVVKANISLLSGQIRLASLQINKMPFFLNILSILNSQNF